MDVEARGVAVGETRELENALSGDAGGDVFVGFAEFSAAVVVPVLGELGEHGLVFDLGGGGLFGEEFLLDALRLGSWIDSDGFGIELMERRALLDDGVAAR